MASTARSASTADTVSGRLVDFEHRYGAAVRTRRLWTLVYLVVFIAALIGSMVVSDFEPGKLVSGLPKAWNYIAGTFPQLRFETLWADIAEWYWGIKYWLRLLLETLLMGFVGTVLGGAVALLLCFSASRNLIENSAIYFVGRRVLEFLRTVPELVFALIFIFAFGLGPFAGVLAIAVHSAGSLGKLFAEVNENVERKQIEGVRAAGSNGMQTLRLGVFPQVLPVILSHMLFFYESNVRSASILGIVGAGGIGLQLSDRIRINNWDEAAFIILMILVTVAVIDNLSRMLRMKIIGRAQSV